MNLKYNSALIIALLCITTMSSFAQSVEIKKALRSIDIEQPSKGIAALEAIAKANPESASNLYYLGLGYIRTGQNEKALQTFEKGIKLKSKEGLCYAGKGHVLLLEKKPSEAKTNLDKALSVSKSKDANVLRAAGAAYLNDTKFLLDAIKALNKAKSINGIDPETHILLGDALLLQNQQQGGEVVSSYERGAKADPKNGKPHYKVGKVFQRARNNEEAIKYFTQAITVDLEYAPAYKELGNIYYATKQGSKAAEALEKYRSISENPGDAEFLLAFAYVMAKNFEKASALFKEITKRSDVPPIARKYPALVYLEQGKLDEAEKAFEEYFANVKPDDIDANSYAEYGKLKLRLKTAEGDSIANEFFAKSLKLDSAQADILQLHGDTYLRRKKYGDAVTVFKQLISIRQQPSSMDLWSIGRAYYLNDQFYEADTIFTKLTEKQPTMTVGPLYAARARANIDSTMKDGLALSMYELFLDKALTNPEKNKKEIIETYEYLGAYNLLVRNDVLAAKEYYEKILALNPKHQQAIDFMNALEK